MITEKDLQEAIAECQGQRNPNANTCIKLAAFLTIQREMFGSNDPAPAFSYAAPIDVSYIDFKSNSEFAEIINGRKAEEIWPIMDELMMTLQAIQPRLYKAVIRQLTE